MRRCSKTGVRKDVNVCEQARSFCGVCLAEVSIWESQFIPLTHTVLELAPPALSKDENVSADVTHRLSCYQLKNPPPKQLRSNVVERELPAHSCSPILQLWVMRQQGLIIHKAQLLSLPKIFSIRDVPHPLWQQDNSCTLNPVLLYKPLSEPNTCGF